MVKRRNANGMEKRIIRSFRVYKNSDKVPNNDFFPNQKPMYLFSSIWNADDWAIRGGLEKTDWKKAPFVSSHKDFAVEGCRWKDPFPACVSTTTDNWWDQYDAWHFQDTKDGLCMGAT
ncbi:putative xyloglucan endotransglucosylase/hydrolase protein 8 [Raphanus sativus]|nr:putative xyloglucan endotransglucosylase/hydrolase protein 8 [Raphanus sativus]